jgi:hypothetical protein
MKIDKYWRASAKLLNPVGFLPRSPSTHRFPSRPLLTICESGGESTDHQLKRISHGWLNESKTKRTSASTMQLTFMRVMPNANASSALCRLRPRGHRRTTRGRCGSLILTSRWTFTTYYSPVLSRRTLFSVVPSLGAYQSVDHRSRVTSCNMLSSKSNHVQWIKVFPSRIDAGLQAGCARSSSRCIKDSASSRNFARRQIP